jgi:hypothetical protein
MNEISRNVGNEIFDETSRKKINEISRNFAKFLLRNFHEISRNFAKLNSISHLFRISRNKKIDFHDHPIYDTWIVQCKYLYSKQNTGILYTVNWLFKTGY